MSPTIPILGDWSNSRPFSDLTKTRKVDDPNAMMEGWGHVHRPGTGGTEAQVGAWNTVQASLLTILAERSRAVARIAVPAGPYNAWNGQRATRGWTGTGFLVGKNLLLTNHHVLNSIDVAKAAEAQFNFQVTSADLLDGPPDQVPPSVNFRLNPDRLFIASHTNDLDYAFVWIEEEAEETFGHVPMTRGSFLVKPGEPTFVIHHPAGRPKETSLDDTELLGINATALVYAADTEGGSSGSPVFGPRGNLIALHHAWRSLGTAQASFSGLTGQLQDGGKTNVLNEGIKLAAIALDLEQRSIGGDDADAARIVLGHFSGSDTLTGLFGGLGRRVSASATSSHEKVVQTYQGDNQDLDIGAWNIRWFANSYDDPEKCRRVASVINDLNLDIWALSEVSPNAVRALQDRLLKEFGQTFDCAFSEPDAGDGKQSTAVMWRPNVVEGRSEPWPDEIDDLLKKSSRDDMPFEAVHGKIFNRYPGLFYFRTKDVESPLDFYLVPLHLKAFDEGSLRRRLASKVLAYSVERMISHHGADKDWVLLGDVNAPLASQDFDGLTDRGFRAMSAKDEDEGAVTYLKSPHKSLIDMIFLSANMAASVDDDDFFVVARDKEVGRFVRNISDHRPIAMRLSLTATPEGAQGARAVDVDEAFADLLTSSGGPASPSPSGSPEWQTNGRTKTEFLIENRAALQTVVEDVNTWLRAIYGVGSRDLTEADLWMVFFLEAGITGSGHVDPTFVHSEGEYGILPLPSNITFWIGNDAPVWHQPMSAETNLQAYARYLGQLKNKRVRPWRGDHLYHALFSTLDGSALTQAKLLAGIVHGYFFSGNYRGAPVPMDEILAGYRQDLPVDDIMRDTGYVHSGTSILVNRNANIEAAAALIADHL